MKVLKQKKLKLLGVTVLLVLIILPGITLAQQVFKKVLMENVANETKEPQEESGEPITTDDAITIQQDLGNKIASDNTNVRRMEIYGNRIAYFNYDTQELISYNLKTKQLTIVSNTPNDKNNLVLAKDKLVWEENDELWAYDFIDGSTIKVSLQYGDLPDVYDDLLVYRGREQAGIYLYNFKTQKTTTITSGGDYKAPTIWKDIVAWVDSSDGYDNVYYRDLVKGETKKITNFTEDKSLDKPIVTKKSIVFPLVGQEGGRQLLEYTFKTKKTETLPGPVGGKFEIKVDKFKGKTINYVLINDEVVSIDLDTKEVKEYPPMENKVMYGGVIIGTEKNSSKTKFKVHRE